MPTVKQDWNDLLTRIAIRVLFLLLGAWGLTFGTRAVAEHWIPACPTIDFWPAVAVIAGAFLVRSSLR